IADPPREFMAEIPRKPPAVIPDSPGPQSPGNAEGGNPRCGFPPPSKLLRAGSDLLFGQLNGPFHHVPGVSGPDRSPAFTAHRVVKAEFPGQFLLEPVGHDASPAAHTIASQREMPGTPLSRRSRLGCPQKSRDMQRRHG